MKTLFNGNTLNENTESYESYSSSININKNQIMYYILYWKTFESPIEFHKSSVSETEDKRVDLVNEIFNLNKGR